MEGSATSTRRMPTPCRSRSKRHQHLCQRWILTAPTATVGPTTAPTTTAETASVAEVLEEVMQCGDIKLEEEAEKLVGRTESRCAGPCDADLLYEDNIWNEKQCL